MKLDAILAELRKEQKALAEEQGKISWLITTLEVQKIPAKIPAAPNGAKRVTPGRRMQGQYIGAINSLSAGDRRRVRARRKKSGAAAAIVYAKSLKRRYY